MKLVKIVIRPWTRENREHGVTNEAPMTMVHELWMMAIFSLKGPYCFCNLSKATKPWPLHYLNSQKNSSPINNSHSHYPCPLEPSQNISLVKTPDCSNNFFSNESTVKGPDKSCFMSTSSEFMAPSLAAPRPDLREMQIQLNRSLITNYSRREMWRIWVNYSRLFWG